MKKGILILVLALMLLLAACGQSTTAPQEKDADEVTQENDAADTPQREEENNLVVGQFTAEDLIFVHNGTAFPLNSDAAKLLEALGDGYETTTAPSCVYGDEGDDKQFDYENVSIFTYPTDGKDLIDCIDLYGGDFETSKGIGIGSTKDEVIAQYGQGDDQQTKIVYALSGDSSDVKSPKLFFDIEDGKVTLISFYAASNVQQ